jgi:hypothetical protein
MMPRALPVVILLTVLALVLTACASGIDVHCAGDPNDPSECATQGGDV